MALVLSDRVKETTTTTGTSDFVLGGAVTGFQTFSAGVGNSNTTYYAVSLGADFEVGLGTLSGDGLTLARTTILQSSNSDTKVSFAAGSKEVFVTYPADKAVFEDASGNVSLPLNLTVAGGSTTDSLQLDLSAAITPAVGQIAWDAAQGTASLGLLGGNIISRLGQSLVAYVTNAESVTITKGQAVYLFSAQGDRATVKLAYNTGDATSAKTLGIVGEDITANGTGFVVCQGVAYGLDLSAFTAGDTLYLGSTAGAITATKPYAPNHLVYLGVVEKSNAGAGQLYVRVQNGYELDELHNVSAQSPTTGQTIVYNSSTSLWEKNTVSLTAGVNGSLPVGNGGTGETNYTNGQLLIGNTTGNTLTKATLTAGSGVTVTNGTGSITIAAIADLVGPSSATDNAITRFDSTTGKLVQNSSVTISDNGAITAPAVGSVIPFYYDNVVDFPSASTYHGAMAHSHGTGAMYFAHGGSWNMLIKDGGPLGTPLSGTLTNLSGLAIDAGTTGTLPINRGGTGTTSTTFANLTTNVTGVLPIANGGTNSTATATAGGIGYGTGTAHAYTAAGTAGQVLTSNASSAPTWQTPTSAAKGFAVGMSLVFGR